MGGFRTRGCVMRWTVACGIVPLLLGLSWTGTARGADAAPAARPRSTLTVWDTGRPSEKALPPAALAGTNDWTTLSPGTTAAFQGDAVVGNGWVVAVLRRQDAAVEVHAVKSDGAVS